MSRALLVSLLLLGGCRGCGAPGDGDGTTQRRRVPHSPRTMKELPTTAGTIALGNLSSQLDAAVRSLGDQPKPESLAALSSLYLLHAQLTDSLADYDRAESLAERAGREGPESAPALLARATTRTHFHHYDDALADLDHAARLGAPRTQVDEGRAAALQGLGRFTEARALRERRARERPTVETLAALAGLDADEGRIEDAELHFGEALDHFSDVTPFPLVLMWLRQGAMWQREGQPARARELLGAALERLPQFPPAVARVADALAEGGERDRAIAMLLPIGARSDDPAYGSQLAVLLNADNRPQEAAAWTARTKARFDELLSAHPEAFAEPAARFFLGAGHDPARALSIADRNFATSRTLDAALLVMGTATAAGQPVHACEAAETALTLGPESFAVHHAAWTVLGACGRADRPEAVLRRAQELGHTN